MSFFFIRKNSNTQSRHEFISRFAGVQIEPELLHARRPCVTSCTHMQVLSYIRKKNALLVH